MAHTAFPTISPEHLRPVIDRVLGRLISSGDLRPEDADDVRSAVMLRALQQFGDRADAPEIRSVDDYVARMTLNAAHDVLRARRSAPAALDDFAGIVADASIEAHEALATRQMLMLLWDEIRQLPLMQRRALLLHARDADGGSVIQLLVFTGVASLDAIAAALEYSRPSLETMWRRLPMADLEIGASLGMTRQQVIGLRRSARERLERARQRLTMPRAKR